MDRRVVVTGMGVLSSLGSNWEDFSANLQNGVSGIKRMDAWDKYPELNTRLGGPVTDFETPAHFTRKKTRSMGRVSLLATTASENALKDAGLLGAPTLGNGKAGVSYGSCSGSTDAVLDFCNMISTGDMSGITATTYIRMMGHTAPVNIGVFFGLKGRVYTTSSACTSSSQGIGYAFEAIRSGQQDIMVAGGAEELCPSQAAVFDTLYATSTANDTPNLTPRPFDSKRDGLVIGEGAGTLILEALEHAQARGAKIYAELVGYGTNSDGGHITQPNPQTMQIAMELALQNAGINASDIDYINAHGTATDQGDIAETTATERLFGQNVPISTLKGNLGHTLGACGAIEAWASINMMNQGWFAPTLNLVERDARCGELDYIIGSGRELSCNYFMTNNFAFGGINTSLIFKRWQ